MKAPSKRELQAIVTQPALFSVLPSNGGVAPGYTGQELARMRSCFADWREVARASVFSMHFLSSRTGQYSDFDSAVCWLVRGGVHWNFDRCAGSFTIQRLDGAAVRAQSLCLPKRLQSG